ncbi:hypothetical protein OC66_12640 [Flavobacterium psychrophilum]|nr:hypothetical protein OC66_12640 [Flavobacterium psychrophilum]
MGIIKNKKSKEVFNLLKTILRRFKGLFFFRLTFYCKRQNNQNKALKSIKKTARPPPGLLSIFFFFVFLFFFFGLFSERTFLGFQPNKNRKQDKIRSHALLFKNFKKI